MGPREQSVIAFRHGMLSALGTDSPEPEVGDVAKYQARYDLAKQRTAEESKHGLRREAAALAEQIRWNPQMLAAYDYPLDMDLATTCCCHIVVDDGNIDDDSVAFCIITAAKNEHQDCLRLSLLLARASLTQRKRVYRRA